MSWLPAASQRLLYNKIIKRKRLGLQKLVRQQRNLAEESNVSMQKSHRHPLGVRGDLVEVHIVKESSNVFFFCLISKSFYKKKKKKLDNVSQIITSQANLEDIYVKYFPYKL